MYDIFILGISFVVRKSSKSLITSFGNVLIAQFQQSASTCNQTRTHRTSAFQLPVCYIILHFNLDQVNRYPGIKEGK